MIGVLLARAWVVAAALLSPAQAAIEPLHVKPGSWEVSSTTKVSVTPGIDASRMGRSERARIEAAMKARLARRGATTVTRECMTRERIETDPSQDSDSSCSRTFTVSTPRLRALTIECRGTAGAMRFEAVDPERVRGLVVMTIGAGSSRIEVATSFVARWTGPGCGDVK